MRGRTQKQRGTAVLFDMDHSEAAYAAAEYLHGLFERVVIVTPRDTIATEIELVTRQGILRRLVTQGIEMIVLSEPFWNDAIEAGALAYRNVFGVGGGEISDVALLTYATPRAPDVTLLEPLQTAGIEVCLVGDCQSPRALLDATASGHAAGCAV